MAHEYSVVIHDWISGKKEKIESELKSAKAQNDEARMAYFEGQVAEIQAMRQFLSDQIDLDTHTYYE